MSRISTEQIIEILDEVGEIRLRKHDHVEGAYVVEMVKRQTPRAMAYDRLDSETGPDLGELINELHTRL